MSMDRCHKGMVRLSIALNKFMEIIYSGIENKHSSSL